MTQGINGYGSINRIGNTNDGRIIYQLTSPDGQPAGKLSIAQKDTDTFERSYRDMMEAAPVLQKFSENHTPEQLERRKNTGKWTGIGIASVATAVPLIFVHKLTPKKWLQWIITIASSLAGIVGGVRASAAISTPPGAVKFAKAMQNMSKIDAQPVE